MRTLLHLRRRSLIALGPFCLFAGWLVPQAVAQDFAGCDKAGYESEIGIALTDGEPTALVHRQWYRQCITVQLDRARYLDSYLETAIVEYLEWQIGIQMTGDEAWLSSETEAALDALGYAFSDAVDRANIECIDEDDWRIAERAIYWWGRSGELDLNKPKYGLDQASFLERLCTKIHLEILSQDGPRVGYAPYTLTYRIGVRLGDNDPHFDIPLDHPAPSIEGGTIIEDVTIDEQWTEEVTRDMAEMEAAIAEMEAQITEMQSDPELAPFVDDYVDLMEDLMGDFGEGIAWAQENPGARSLTIAVDNSEAGLAIELQASMVDIPLVAGRFVHEAEQNPYWGSSWRFTIDADAIVSQNNTELGEFAHRAEGRFRIVWPPVDDSPDASNFLQRTFSDYITTVTFNDYESTSYGTFPRRCENYFSPTLILDGRPRFHTGDSEYVGLPDIYPPDRPFTILNHGAYSLSIMAEASDPAMIPMVYLRPMYLFGDVSFEYTVDCYQTRAGGSVYHTEHERTKYPGESFEAFLPLENITATAEASSSNGSGHYDWLLSAELTCLSGCPTEEELAPPEILLEPIPDPPEEEQDICDPEYVARQCEADLRSAILQCSEFDDWQVSMDESGSTVPRTYCEDLACAGATARSNASSVADIFTAISHETDAECSNTTVNACSVTCVGYH